MEYQFLPVERIHYGLNIISEKLTHEIEKLKVKNILIVTTNSLLKSETFQSLIKKLEKKQYKTFMICVKQHVPGDHLFHYLEEINQFKPDLILSCGGGSPIDAAKIISFILSEGIESESHVYAYSENIGKDKIEMGDFIPNFAIPTTLSASEFTSIAGITSSKDQVKYKFSHLNMTPQQVFLDPVFTIDTPDWLWTSTGIRAVDHAVETLYSPNPNPVNTGLALQALKKLYHYLPLTKQYPENLLYRLECQIGAWLSLFSVVNIKLGLSHSIGHQLGALYNIPHGMTSAIMLPKVMKFLLPSTAIAQAEITSVLGEENHEISLEDNAKIANQLIAGLIKDLEIPHRLRDFEVDKETIPQVVKHILLDIKGEENVLVQEIEDVENKITNLLESVW